MTATRFDGRRALVVGGAGGIGRATARLLGEDGAAVAILDRAPDLERTAAELDAVPCGGDIADPVSAAAAVERAAAELGGRCDLLVNAAGLYRIAPLDSLAEEEWDEVMAVNLAGPLHVSRAFVAALGGGEGAIVNVSSIAAYRSAKAEPAAHYRASKAALESLTREMAVEWAPSIRVNAVSPGVIATSMLRMMDDPVAGQELLDRQVPLRRVGEPEEVAGAIAFLLSDQAAYITGIALPVDGGAMSC